MSKFYIVCPICGTVYLTFTGKLHPGEICVFCGSNEITIKKDDENISMEVRDEGK